MRIKKFDMVLLATVIILLLSLNATGYRFFVSYPERTHSNVFQMIEPSLCTELTLADSVWDESSTFYGSVSSPVAEEINGRGDQFVSQFLTKYWQKKPVLIRNYIENIVQEVDVSRDMLQYLAMEEDVESRIIAKSSSGVKWKKKPGPFRKVDIENLPKGNWTLLVQEVDRHVPGIADLWSKYFDFIPSWRRDDVMISYARQGGGIGAHVDNYDVFLVQGRGQRRWCIENNFVSATEEKAREVPNTHTRLLRNFIPHQSWVMSPGDCLYLPPRIPHRGESLDDECITISMGFRAPSYISLCSAYLEYVCSTIIGSAMYSDPKLAMQTCPGSVSFEAVADIKSAMQMHLNAGFKYDDAFKSWLGRYLTTPLRTRSPYRPFFLSDFDKSGANLESKNTDLNDICNDDDDEPLPLYVRGPYSVATSKMYTSVTVIFEDIVKGTTSLRRAEGLRVAFLGEELFIDGEGFTMPCMVPVLGRLLCENVVLDGSTLSLLLSDKISGKDVQRLVVNLIERGYFYPIEKP